MGYRVKSGPLPIKKAGPARSITVTGSDRVGSVHLPIHLELSIKLDTSFNIHINYQLIKSYTLDSSVMSRVKLDNVFFQVACFGLMEEVGFIVGIS